MEFKKIKAVLVQNETEKRLKLNNGASLVAAVPPSVGDKTWGVIDTRGKFVRISGSKLGTLGVEKALLGLGYTKAEPGNPAAEKLLDELAGRTAIKVVEAASQEVASSLQKQYAGQRVQVVPFSAREPISQALIKGATSSMCVALGMGAALSSGMVQVHYCPEDKSVRSHDIEVNRHWIVPIETDTAGTPRVSDYGGPVEEAAFMIQNLGLAVIQGDPHLVMPEETGLQDPMPRGRMTLALPDSGEIRVGIDAGDELVVELWREGSLRQVRRGMLEIGGNNAVNVGNAVGSILAVLALEQWKLSGAPKRKMAKAA